MKFKLLKNTIASNGLKPIYFITGEDSFLKNQAKNMIIYAAAINMPELNIDVLDSECTNPDEIVSKSLTVPFLSEKRVVVVNDYNLDKKQKALLEYLQQPNNNTVLIFINEKMPDAVIQTPNIDIVDCGGLDSELTKKWIVSRLKTSNKFITGEAVELLQKYTLSNFSQLDTEIEKLISYLGEKEIIETVDVEKIVSQRLDYQVYQLINYICGHSKEQAYITLKNLFEKNINSQIILISLYNHFRAMFFQKINKLSVAQLKSELSISDYKAREIISSNDKFNALKIAQILKLIADMDYKIKTGKIDGELAVEYVITCAIV